MFRKLFVFILVSLTLSAQAYVDESSCTDMDIRDYHPGLRKHFSTPRNQGSIGWCYAFAAADLLSVEAGKPVSSFHVASIYNSSTYSNSIYNYIRSNVEKADINDIYESGWLARAVKKVVERKTICSELIVPFNAEKRETNEFINALHELSIEAHEQKLNLREVLNELLRILPQEFENKLNLRAAARSLKYENINIAVEKIVSQTCANKSLKVPALATNIVTYYTHGRSRYYSVLNSALNEGRPVALRYNSGIYTKNKSNGSHISVLSARRWKNGRCQYKIRNSWGKGCSSYKQGIDCIQSEGAFWINASDLTDNKNTFYYLSGKDKFSSPYKLKY